MLGKKFHIDLRPQELTLLNKENVSPQGRETLYVFKTVNLFNISNM